MNRTANKQLQVSDLFRQVGKRTTIFNTQQIEEQRQNDNKRLSSLDNFKKFTTQILPKMEETIEIGLLSSHLAKFNNEQIKKDLINSYLKRRVK